MLKCRLTDQPAVRDEDEVELGGVVALDHVVDLRVDAHALSTCNM